MSIEWIQLTATSILSLPTSSMLRMTFFSIFTSWESFFARSGPKAPAVVLRKAWPAPPWEKMVSLPVWRFRYRDSCFMLIHVTNCQKRTSGTQGRSWTMSYNMVQQRGCQICSLSLTVNFEKWYTIFSQHAGELCWRLVSRFENSQRQIYVALFQNW